MDWKSGKWRMAGLLVAITGMGAIFWFTEGGERDDDDEQAASRAMAAVPESAAPTQKAGTTFVYNFDSDATGQLPAKFHQARTGGGGPVSWVIQQDGSAPSNPNVLTQTSADKTDYRFPFGGR